MSELSEVVIKAKGERPDCRLISKDISLTINGKESKTWRSLKLEALPGGAVVLTIEYLVNEVDIQGLILPEVKEGIIQ